MAQQGFARVLGACALGLGLQACGGNTDEIEEVSSKVVTANALTMNALTMNALTMNALTMNALTMNALTMNALTMNALTMNGLRDPLARQFLKYAVSCALPADRSLTATVDGQAYVFPGQLGLAPEWAEERGGSCDESCQRWVSGCMIARVDHAGVERPISVRGASRALQTTPKEERDYRYVEAAYFGNVFVDGQPRFFCLPPHRTRDERVCGDSIEACGLTMVGPCEDACADEGPHGSFVDCSAWARGGDRGRRRDVFHESITVFLPNSPM
jgi:hypothetical protein